MLLHRSAAFFRTVRWLSAIHLAGTSAIGSGVLVLLANAGIAGAPKRYEDYSVYSEFDPNAQAMEVNAWLTLMLSAFVLLQLTRVVQPVAFSRETGSRRSEIIVHKKKAAPE